MKCKLRQYISGFMALIFLFTSLSVTAFADDSYIGGEGGNTGGVTGKGTDWSTDKQGYRVTVVDNTGAKMCEPVDYWFSIPTGNIAYYKNFKLETMTSGQTSKHVIVSDMLSDPSFAGTTGMPPPLLWESNRAVGNGEALKTWLLAGGNWNTQAGSASGSGGSGGSTGGGSGGGEAPPLDYDAWHTGRCDVIIDGFKSMFQECADDNMMSYPPTPPLNAQIQLFQIATERIKALDKIIIPDWAKNYIIVGTQAAVNDVYVKYCIDYKYWEKLTGAHVSARIDTPNINLGSIAIPLAEDAPATEGYINPFLNYKDTSGQFVLDVQKPADYDATIAKLGIDDLVENRIAIGGYYVFIEPIVWCTPLDRNWTRYSSQVYGTITNFGQWANDMNGKGWDDNQLGGQMGSILNYSGSWSLWLNDQIPQKDGQAPNVHVPTKYSVGAGVINGELSKSDEGYALHVYTPNQITAAGTHTWDSKSFPLGDPGPAPEFVPTNPEDPSKDPDGGTPPSPGKDPDNPATNPYKITIIKYYERNDIPESNFVREKNPGQIQIQDEPLYSLEDWFISTEKKIPSSDKADYDDVKSSTSKTSDGTNPSTVDVKDPNTTLYLKLVAQDPIPEGDLVIQQSQISKSISTLHNTTSGWGIRTFNFNCADMSGSHTYFDDCGDDDDPCPGHNCKYDFGDSSYNFRFLNNATMDSKIQAEETQAEEADGFNAILTRGSEAKGAWALTGGNKPITSFDYESVIWRGANQAGIPDVPTLANYKPNDNTNQVDKINKLVVYRANIPAKKRQQNNIDYKIPLLIQLAVDRANSDLIAYSVHTKCGGGTATPGGVDLTNTIAPHKGDVTVKVYAGKAGQLGNETSSSKLTVAMNFGSAVANAQSGFMVQSQAEIKFYPYIRMTYQLPKQYDPSRTNVNVVSEFLRSMKPNDYAEAGWYQTEDEDLKLTSNQWSTHARAINNGKDWNGKNQVLPGGAIYNLNTINNATKVKVATWQTYIEGEQRDIINTMGTGLSAADFTLS